MYEEFYGLTGKPFQLSPDPTFYFGSKGHTSAFSYLKYGVYQSEGFLVITGEVGAGKTTLVRACWRSSMSAPSWRRRSSARSSRPTTCCAPSPRPSGAACRPTTRRDCSPRSRPSCDAVQQNKRALLIVDEAQNLTPRAIEELRMLSNFQFGDQALLQSFLVGQPELRNLMRAADAAVPPARHRLVSPGAARRTAETHGYIEHRLQRVAWKGDPGFEPVAIHAIYMATGGIPRRINTDVQPHDARGLSRGQTTSRRPRSTRWRPRSRARLDRRPWRRRCASH